MLNKKMNIILLFLFIFLIGCDKKESVKKEKKNNLENIHSNKYISRASSGKYFLKQFNRKNN